MNCGFVKARENWQFYDSWNKSDLPIIPVQIARAIYMFIGRSMEGNRRQEQAGKGIGRRVPDPASLSLSVVGLPRDVVESLADAGIATLADFASHDAEEIVRIRGVGTGSVRRVRRWLELQGLEEILIDPAPRLSGLAHKRASVRFGTVGEESILPVPESLVNAPVPLHAMPARIANLLRRHGVRTLGELYAAIQRKTSLEGFGIGTRGEVIESLPRIYVAAAQAMKSPEIKIQRESLAEVVSRLRKANGRPVQIGKVAHEFGTSEADAVLLAQQSNEILFVAPWCLTPDEKGLSDAICVLQAGELGEALAQMMTRVLSEREHQVLERWVGLGRPTLRHGQIARDLERSRERIRQLRQRAIMKVSGMPVAHGLLSAMADNVVRMSPTMPSDEAFATAFEAKYGLLLGPDRAPGFARLCLRGLIGLA